MKKQRQRLDSRPGFAYGLSGFAWLRPYKRRGRYKLILKKAGFERYRMNVEKVSEGVRFLRTLTHVVCFPT